MTLKGLALRARGTRRFAARRSRSLRSLLGARPLPPRPVGLALPIAAAMSATIVAQKPDRSAPPKPAAPPALRLPPVQKHTVERVGGVGDRTARGADCAGQSDCAGATADPAGKYGIASMTANMLDEGAGNRSALELADAVDFLGAQLATVSNFDFSAVRLSTPVANLGDALSLMADVVIRPSFPAAELERLRKERLTRLLQARDDPAAIIEIAFPRLVFGDKHRYGTSAGGGTPAVKARRWTTSARFMPPTTGRTSPR